MQHRPGTKRRRGKPSPEPLRRQDRAGQATLEHPATAVTEGEATERPVVHWEPHLDRPPEPCRSRRRAAVRGATHRPLRPGHRLDAVAARLREPRRADVRRDPGRDSRRGRPGPADRRLRGRCSPGAARPRCDEPAPRGHDRAGLPRHDHPAGHPAQRARGPELVHRLHAVPAGDLTGSARGPAELPDRDRRPDRPAHRQRVPARRGHRRGRGDDSGTAREPQGVRSVRGRRRRPAADHRPDPHPGPGDGHRGRRGGPDRRVARR